MGKNICNLLKEEDVGSIGIGAMIVFIAMVLVAGIAASVLISTSTNLEMQALKTGRETIDDIASGIKVESIEGYNQSGLITKMAVEIAPLAGSPHIDMSQVVVEISDSDNKYLLRYGDDATNVSSVNGSIFDVSDFGDANSFDIIVLQDADESVTADANTPVINYGDHIVLAIDTNSIFGGILPRTDVFGMVIPESGAPGVIGFVMPSSFTDDIMELQ